VVNFPRGRILSIPRLQFLRLRGFIFVTLIVAILGVAQALDPLPPGLTVTHFSDTNWTSTPVRSEIDSRPSTERLFAGWRGRPPDAFSTTWRGSIITLRGGAYMFATSSDDGSWVYVDGQLVVENAGHHEARTVSGTVRLERGVHSIFIKYFQDGGPFSFDLLWARDGGTLEPVPSWALAPRGAEFFRFLASVVLRRAWVFAALAWLAAAIAIVARAAWRDALSVRPSLDWALVVAGGAVLLFVMPHQIIGDGFARYLALAQLMEWHEIPSTAYSMVGPLLSLPLYLLGKLAFGPEWWCARFNAIVFLAGLWIAARLMRDSVDEPVRVRFLLVALACSMFWNHLEGYYAEAFTATLAGIGLLAVDRGFTTAGWTAAVVGVVNTPATLAGLGTASAVHVWSTRRLRHLLPVFAAAAAILLESWIRRGSPFVTGYEGNHGDTTVLTYSGRPGFSYPWFFGVLSILFSFGKGLAFYAPGLLLPIKRRPGFYVLWLAFLAGLVGIYAKWWAWFGGLFWGPRFFVVASLPASFAIAAWLVRARELTTARRALLFAVLTLSAWVAVDGAAFGYSGLGTCRDPNHEWLCLYVPEFSALWRPFVEWTQPATTRLIVAAYIVVVYAWLAWRLVDSFIDDGREWLRVTRVSIGIPGPWRF